jgi:hypothetical protein
VAEEVTWAIDLADDGAALAIALLLDRKQRVHCLSGVAVSRAPGTYRGEGKTDAKNAAVIADQARMRRDLSTFTLEGELDVELRMLTTHRSDLTAEGTRNIIRLRSRLMEIFPALNENSTSPIRVRSSSWAAFKPRRSFARPAEATWSGGFATTRSAASPN